MTLDSACKYLSFCQVSGLCQIWGRVIWPINMCITFYRQQEYQLIYSLWCVLVSHESQVSWAGTCLTSSGRATTTSWVISANFMTCCGDGKSKQRMNEWMNEWRNKWMNNEVTAHTQITLLPRKLNNSVAALETVTKREYSCECGHHSSSCY